MKLVKLETNNFVFLIIWFVFASSIGLVEAQPSVSGIPIKFTLEKPSYVTLVIENIEGKRVKNLVSNQLYKAGETTIFWDGYDDLKEVIYTDKEYRGTYDIKKILVNPGTYILRGLIHEGIRTRYEFSVYSPSSPSSPPWRVRTNPNGFDNKFLAHKGGWIGDHGFPLCGIAFKPKGSGMPAEYGPDQDVIIICGDAGESNDLVAWLDMDGNKIYGTNSVNWTGKIGWAANECIPRNTAQKDGLTYTINSTTHQIDVSDGRKIGKPGGPQIGIYDEERMHNPIGIVIDNMGRLWVAEQDEAPRRLSIWNAKTGAFIKAIYGPPKYGGGGIIDYKDSTRLYYWTGWNTNKEADVHRFKALQVLIEFKLNWETGEAKPYAIPLRPQLTGTLIMNGTAPEDVTYIGGRQYMYNQHGGWQKHCLNQQSIWLMRDDHILVPVAAIGQVCEHPTPTHTYWNALQTDEIKAKMPAAPLYEILYTWSDLNHNQKVEVDEVKFKVFKTEKNNSRFTLAPDLSAMNAAGLHFDPPTFDEKGVPIYNLESGQFYGDIKDVQLAAGPTNYYDKAFEPLDCPDGYFVFTGWPILGFYNKQLTWKYHAQDRMGLPRWPGDVMYLLKYWGPAMSIPYGEAGVVWVVGHEKGGAYMFTSDGLFITELFGDMRVKPLWVMKECYRGMIIDCSTFDETYYNTVTMLKSGSLYTIAGKEHMSICKIEGLEKVRRLPPVKFDVTGQDISTLPPVVVSPQQQTSPVLYLSIGGTAPGVDGNLAEWDSTLFVKIDERTSAALKICGKMLYAAYKTGDQNLLVNAGGENGDFKTIFKTGGALDLFMATDSISSVLDVGWKLRPEPVKGDIRLLVTKVNGQKKAILFEAVVPGTPEAQKTIYSSMIAKTVIDRITDISDNITLAGKDGNYEFSIRLDILGIPEAKMVNGMSMIGDIGILRGKDGVTSARLYWKNKTTYNVSDIPTEAKFQPNQWGLFRLQGGTSVIAGNISSIPSADIKVNQRQIIVYNPANTTALFTITALNGELVYSRIIENKSNSVVSVKSIGRGLYICQISIGGSKLLRQLIIR